MYTVFNTVPRIGAVNIATIDLDYVRTSILGSQMTRYREYRYQTPGIIRTDHLLLKVLNMIQVPFDGDLMMYQSRVAAQVTRITGSMGFSNSSHHGRVFDKGTFYGDDISEIIVTANESYTPRDLWNNWENMSAVRALSHPINGSTVFELDGSLRVPGAYRSSVNLAVLELDIPLLACQFQMWKLANRTQALRAEVIPDGYFISQIVLPNLLMSHLDIAILNTMSDILGIGGTFEVKSNLPFYLTDHSGRFDTGLEDILRRYTVQTTTFSDMLMNVPCFSVETLMQAIKMPEVAFTNQVIWALTAARLPLVAFLLKMNSVNSNAKNDMYVNRFRRSLIEAESGKYLKNQLPADVAEYFAEYLDKYVWPYLKEI